MRDNLRIGIIGSGFVARTHAHSISRGLHHATLAGVAGGTRAEQLASDFSTTFYPSPNALAASEEVDAVVIATPHSFHHEHALLCAGTGKHVLIEKPMATSAKDCSEIIAGFRSRRLCLMVAFTQRFRQSNVRAFDIIHQGTIGKVLMVQEYALLPNGLQAYPGWQQQPDNLGILFGYGIHNIDKLRWFLQDEVESLSATLHRSKGGIETSSMTTLRWTGGALTHIWSSVDLPSPGFESTAFRSQIVGDKGLLDVDGYGKVQISLQGEPWKTLFVQPPIDWRGAGMFSEARMGSFNAQNQAFVDSVLAGTEPPVTGADGLQAVKIALAAYESADTHQTIHLNTH